MMLYIFASVFVLTFFIYAILEGFVQAHYYVLMPREHAQRNLHSFFMISRAIVVGYIFLAMAFISEYLLSFVFTFSMICMFSFFHNGMYYATYHSLNPKVYTKGWWDSSETSEAVIELGTGFRTVLAVFGAIGLVLTYLEFRNY